VEYPNISAPSHAAPAPGPLLPDRTLLVAGASGGIGAQIARLAVAQGARVVLLGRDAERLEGLRKELAGHGGEAIAAVADVCDAESLRLALERCRDHFPPPDLLVTSVVYGQRQVFLCEQEEEDWVHTIDVNLNGAFRLCRRVVPEMMRRRSGGIVLISSVAGTRGLPSNTAYCASKFGLNGLAKALAAEVGPFGVRVNAVCPGLTDTQLLLREDAYGQDFMDSLRRHHGPPDLTWARYVNRAVRNTAIRRLVRPEEVAWLTVFLLSDLSSGMTGQTIGIDGGS